MPASPAVSVIIPVHNGAAVLGSCLTALRGSSQAPVECIVVDDSSTDDSADVARQHSARVILVSARRGPACARNRAAAEARGEILFFLDADVRVHRDGLARVAAAFADPMLDAVIGSYDDSPADPGFVSQYRNLLHCFVHQNAQREACTFWAGCGAIRKSVFQAVGGFDESYRRPSIEDIELGYRLIRGGHRIALDKLLRGTHLKRWTFWGMLTTDIRDRALPWTRLIAKSGKLPNDLNVRWSQRISGGLALAMVTAVLIGPWLLPLGTVAASALGLFLIVTLLNLPFYRFLAKRKGAGFAGKAAGLYTLYLIYSTLVFLIAAPVYRLVHRNPAAKDAWPARAD